MRAVVSVRLTEGDSPSVRLGSDGTAVVSFCGGDDPTVELVGPKDAVEKWLDAAIAELNLVQRANTYRLIHASSVFAGDTVNFPGDGYPRRWWKVNRAEKPDDYTIRLWLVDHTQPRDVHPDDFVRIVDDPPVCAGSELPRSAA